MFHGRDEVGLSTSESSAEITYDRKATLRIRKYDLSHTQNYDNLSIDIVMINDYRWFYRY